MSKDITTPKEVWYDRDGKPLHRHTNLQCRAATRNFAAARHCLECRKEDFGELRHFDGISPAWAILLRRDRAVLHGGGKNLYHVHGTRGEDPTEPWRSAEYPFPAVSHEPRIEHLAEAPCAAWCQAVSRSARHSVKRNRPPERVRPVRDMRRFPVSGSTPNPIRISLSPSSLL